MIKLQDKELSTRSVTWLRKWQSEVDSKASFPDQVEAAKDMFPKKNKKGNKTFDEVKRTLQEMQGGLVRCVYCEDSVADEVEHIAPKDLYPDKVFKWDNYSYACGPCNGPKSNKFSVFRKSDEKEIDVTPPHPRSRPADWKPKRPPVGLPLLINPRKEDPLQFLWLDLEGTYRLDPLLELSGKRFRRAEYTWKTLRLNRDYLLKARRNAYLSLRSKLSEYSRESNTEEKENLRKSILETPHRTVWHEMIRQRNKFSRLTELFLAAPEALKWDMT